MTPLRSLVVVALAATLAPAQKPDEIKPAASKITSVTVYQNTALVTREVTLPEGAGQTEVIVSPMPPATVQSSLYAEGTDAVRVLSSRFRTRAIAEDNREEVRKLENEIKMVQKGITEQDAELKAVTANLAFTTKLESFTAATMNTLTEKGQLDAEKTLLLAKSIREDRTKYIKEEAKIKAQLATDQEKLAFLKLQLQERSGGVSRTERDAVIVIDKKAGAGTVKLNYLVSNANWKPQYKLRAATKAGDPVALEYQASVTQQTGEDWTNVNLILSTAQPLLNAAPPDLRTLEVAIGGPMMPAVPNGPGQSLGYNSGRGEGSYSKELKDLEAQAKSQRSMARDNLNKKAAEEAFKLQNDAAATEQFRDLLCSADDLAKGGGMANPTGDGPSVTFRLKSKLTLPSRMDDQTLEITKLELQPKFYYKAVPVLTPSVYRLADLVNTTDYILLPGDANMYLDTDFVGSTKLPLVAAGKPFTVGFGVDPQLQVTRKLMDKTRSTQGGNQVLTFKYKIMLSSYKSTAVDVQVWDRMPHAEAVNAIAVQVGKTVPELSADALYVRDDKPKNLLRWDVKVEKGQNGEKTLNIDYDYKLELDKNVTIGSFLAK